VHRGDPQSLDGAWMAQVVRNLTDAKDVLKEVRHLIVRSRFALHFGSGNEALVKYLCTTKKGKTFRNVEYLRFKDADGKIAAIECYFGEMGSFPSSVDKKG
jgi:hypothetical protein